MGNGSGVFLCVYVCVSMFLCLCGRVVVFLCRIQSVGVCGCLCDTPGSRWNSMLIGWRSVGEFGAD